MGTSQRIRRRFDRGRLGQLAEQPGIDPRSWIVLGRVDDDDDAIRWTGTDGEDGPLGWIVDVTIGDGGDLDQESEIPCRLGAAYAREGELRSDPPARGCLVLVAMPCGNLNTEPTIIGELPTDGCAVPGTVNGTDIDEAYALATHILVTTLDVDEQIDGDRRVKTGGTNRVLGPTLELADEGATQSFVKGDDQQQALDTFLTALDTWITSVESIMTAAPFPKPGLTGPKSALSLAISALKNDLSAALSTKIKGE